MLIKQEDNQVTVCSLEGEVNMNTSPQLRKDFDAVMKSGAKKIIVDFSKVSYIDSSGLATLIEVFQRLKKASGSLRLCQLNDKVKSVFEITKLSTLFAIFDTKQLALEGF